MFQVAKRRNGKFIAGERAAFQNLFLARTGEWEEWKILRKKIRGAEWKCLRVSENHRFSFLRNRGRLQSVCNASWLVISILVLFEN
jgi:hypothetical protein